MQNEWKSVPRYPDMNDSTNKATSELAMPVYGWAGNWGGIVGRDKHHGDL